MNKIIDLLKQAGYPDRAIEYYTKKVNVGTLKKPSVSYSYTGPCGDIMEFYLTIEDGIIKDAKFQALGCAGAFSSGSALCEMVKEKTLEQAGKITEQDIIDWLGGLPAPKFHCACLAKRTLQQAIDKYKKGSAG